MKCGAARRFKEVRVLDKMKEMLGVMDLEDAIALSEQSGSDVILLNDKAEPPLVRICAMSKYRYELDKIKKDAAKKQRESKQTMKELKFSPRTDVHDFDVKVRQAYQFLSKGDKVKLVIQFKGREINPMRATAEGMVQRFISSCEEVATVENPCRMAGTQMTAMLAPKKEP